MDVKYSIENKRRLSTLRNSIKSRPSQYISLIIGIILSITFLSIIVLLVTSIPSTLRAYFYTQMGNAELIVLDTTPSKMDQYLSQGTVTEYGLGEAWAKVNVGTDENLFVGKLDNKSQKHLNLDLIEGEMPTKAGEIAIELDVMRSLRQTYSTGEKISLSMQPLSMESEMEDASSEKLTSRTFTIVGILRDKQTNIGQSYNTGDAKETLFSLYIADDEKFESPFVPHYIGYAKASDAIKSQMQGIQGYSLFVKKYTGMDAIYLTPDKYYDDYYSQEARHDLVWKVVLVSILLASFILAASLAIRNSMQSVLESKKKQLALMRAIGATKKQIQREQLKETMFLVLLCIPIGLGFGYFILKLISHYIYNAFIINHNPLIGLLILAFSSLVLFLSSIGPINRAAKVSPMQAIRQTDLSRVQRLKKTESRLSFSVANLLAKRNIILYRNKMFGIYVFLTLSLVLAIGLAGFLQGAYNQVSSNTSSNDYELFSMAHWPSRMFPIEDDYLRPGISNNEVYRLKNLPLVKTVHYSALIPSLVEVDQLTQYMTLEGEDQANAYLKADPSNDEYKLKYDNLTKMKEKFSLPETLIHLPIYAFSEEMVRELLIESEGKISIDAINSGKDALLYTPKIAVVEGKDYTWLTEYKNLENEDEAQARIYENDYFTLGQSLAFHYFYTTEALYTEEDFYGHNISSIPQNTKEISGQVHIGGIISESTEKMRKNMLGEHIRPSIITTVEGLNQLGFKNKYAQMRIQLRDKPDEEMAEYLDGVMQEIAWKDSNIFYLNQLEMREKNFNLMKSIGIAALAIFIVFLGITASIINRNMTSRIRDGKLEIGTMRAVGATKHVIWKSYVLQIIRFFFWGTILGFGFGSILLLLMKKYLEYDINFLPFVLPLVFLILLILLLIFMMYRKLSVIMKKSIVDNIRQLLVILAVLSVLASNLAPSKVIYAAEPTETPRVMITEFEIEQDSKDVLLPGDEIVLNLKMKNVQPGMEAKNFVISFQSEDNSFLALDMADKYIYSIPAWVEQAWKLPIKVLETSTAGLHYLSFNLAYEDKQGGTHQFTQRFPVYVHSETRVEHDQLHYPKSLVQGEVLDIDLNIMNTGKEDIHNVMLQTNIPELTDTVSALIGTITSSSSSTGKISLFVDPKQKPGEYSGYILLRYENSLAEVFEEKLDISLVVEEKIDIQEKIKAEKEEEKQKQETIPTFVWYILAALIAVLFLTIILQAIRIRKYKAAEEARL